jgi:ABC-type branched-subunit amino acid transport system ATPase component
MSSTDPMDPRTRRDPGTPGMAGEPALSLRDVEKRFGGIRAVNGVSLEVAAGETTAIVGPNGAGKSTLFGLISGEIRPSEGTILMAGRDVARIPPEGRARLGLGRTFQSARLFAGLTVLENVQVPLTACPRARGGWHGDAHGSPHGDVRVGPRGDPYEMLREVQLEEPERTAGTLAQGERKRLELAMVLAGRPNLLLLDEPTAGMGPGERGALMELIAEVVRRRGLTMVFTEHDMDTVFAHASRIVVMDRGRSIADGSPRSVREDERVREIYLGASS